MITTSRAAWALAGALVLASAACGGTTDADGDTAGMPAVVKIGVPLDTSGAAGIAGVGTNEYEGLKLAKEEIESTRFLGGTKIELVFVDTKADKQASVAAVLKMVDKDKVDAIVGFTLTPSFLAAAPQAQSKGVPVIALGLSAPDVTKVGPSVYRILPDVSRMYPARDVTFSQAFSAKTAAYLYNNDTETVVAIHGARKKGLEAAGIETVAEQTMTQKDTDLRTQLTEIKKANPDIIILSTFPGQFASVYLQADEIGLEKQIVATDGTAGEQILSQAAAAMQCVVYTAVWSAQSQSGNNQNFQKLLQQKTGKPGDLFYAVGYDALWVYASALKNAGTADKTKVTAALGALTGFKGALGEWGFDADRNPTISGTPQQIQGGKPVAWTPETKCAK